MTPLILSIIFKSYTEEYDLEKSPDHVAFDFYINLLTIFISFTPIIILIVYLITELIGLFGYETLFALFFLSESFTKEDDDYDDLYIANLGVSPLMKFNIPCLFNYFIFG